RVLTCSVRVVFLFPSSFSFTQPAPHGLSPLSLHDALPISPRANDAGGPVPGRCGDRRGAGVRGACSFLDHDLRSRLWPCLPTISDRKSTRLNSSHVAISYAVFCLKKKKKKKT